MNYNGSIFLAPSDLFILDKGWIHRRGTSLHDDAGRTGVQEGEGGGRDKSYIDGVLLENATGRDDFGWEINHHKHHKILDQIGGIQIQIQIHYIVYHINLFEIT